MSLHKLGLPPVLNGRTEILILGTLPSDLSLAKRQYYANRTNDFWQLVGAAIGKSLTDVSYEERLRALDLNRIGLWDIYHSCTRSGSLDENVASGQLNDLASISQAAPNIKLVCLNGRHAAESANHIRRLGYQVCLLPSSSGANRRNSETRLARWISAIRDRLSGGEVAYEA